MMTNWQWNATCVLPKLSGIVFAMILPLVALSMFPSAQPAGTYIATVFGPSGGELVENCREVTKVQRKEEADALGAQACISYIAGVVDGGQFAARGERRLFPVCFPPGVDGNQMAKIVVKFGDDHPEKLNNGGTWIVINALRSAFPCGQ
jgi:hypothetical protein